MTATPYGLMSPFPGTVEAIFLVKCKGPRKVGGACDEASAGPAVSPAPASAVTPTAARVKPRLNRITCSLTSNQPILIGGLLAVDHLEPATPCHAWIRSVADRWQGESL